MSGGLPMESGAQASARRRAGLGVLQRLGRSLMLPIAALPVAALLYRLGQPDMLGAGDSGLALASHWPQMEPVADVLAAAGGALITNLPLIFAVGVAVGFARKSDGSTALAAVVGYLVFTAVEGAMSPYVLADHHMADGGKVQYGIFGGILVGVVTALLWQRYYRIRLPTYLAFFGGRRFVPIITALVTLVLGVVLSFAYPAFDAGLTHLGEWLVENSILGAGIYGFANRLLIPFGLHHILNSVPWFAVGSYETTGGEVVHGDIARFLAGDPSAGAFMTGFFPIMMFALPAAALAIYHEASRARKNFVGGVMLSGALTSFVTGVTEPLEFAFLFVAWPLYLIHAFLTGTSLALVNALGIKDGFGFSAGAIDYTLNFTAATKPLWLIPIGLVYAVVYYALFRFAIRRWNLATPGRERADKAADDVTEPAVEPSDQAAPREPPVVPDGEANVPGEQATVETGDREDAGAASPDAEEPPGRTDQPKHDDEGVSERR